MRGAEEGMRQSEKKGEEHQRAEDDLRQEILRENTSAPRVLTLLC